MKQSATIEREPVIPLYSMFEMLQPVRRCILDAVEWLLTSLFWGCVNEEKGLFNWKFPLCSKKSDSNFTYKVPLWPSNDFNKVVVFAATIPKSFYSIALPTDTFTLVESGANTTITIIPGNYSVLSFALILLFILSAIK